MRFVPLPSIGGENTDASIRRVLIDLPPECPIEPSDILWALAGQRLPALVASGQQGPAGGAQLVESRDGGMLWQYGIVGKPADRWRTVTPAVLPVRPPPGRRSGSERARFEEVAALSVADAFRHAGIGAKVCEVRSQREPFISRGKLAGAFDSDRFELGRLRHLEVVLSEPRLGPMLVGDGRWLGLGLLCPVRGGREVDPEQAAVAGEPRFDVPSEEADLGGSDVDEALSPDVL
ncbi:MAG: type I-G CRISPR-associated protein Csb2 [Candidatus Dormibacteria bacterium]